MTIKSHIPPSCPRCGRPVAPGESVCACGFNAEGTLPLQGEEASSAVADEPATLASTIPGKRKMPSVTYFLIAACTLVFLLMTLMGGSTHITTLLSFGAMYRPLFMAGEYWRLLTPLFLHIGLLHLLFNMYALLILGRVVEQLYGSTRYMYLYLISGIGGAVGSVLFSKAVSAGASGAIFGVSGVALVAGYRYRDQIPSNFRSMVGRGIVPFVLYNLVYGALNRGIDNYAHLGGLITGAGLALLIPPLRPEERPLDRGLLAFGNLLPLGLILVSFFFPLRAHFEMKRVEVDFERALSLEKEERYDESIASYQRALKMRPDLPSIHNNLAVLYTRQGRYEEAEREARAAVGLDDGEAMYHQTLGAVLWHQRRIQEAVDQYHRATELDPKNAELHEALAAIYQEQLHLKDALQEWLKVKELRPDDPNVDNQIEAIRHRIAAPKPVP
jgi:rhomboid protease GluP